MYTLCLIANYGTAPVFQDIPHTSLAGVLACIPWQIDIHMPILPAKFMDQGGIVEGCLHKTTELSARLSSLFRSDSKCSVCKRPLLDCSCDQWCTFASDTTFQPTPLLRQRLACAGWSIGDRLHTFGRGGSPFCGFPLEGVLVGDDIEADDMGCFLAMFFVSWLCPPLFKCGSDHRKRESESGSWCALLQSLGAAPDPKAEADAVRMLITTYFNRKSSLESSEPTSPGQILRTWIGEFPQEYVKDKMGVLETTQIPAGQKKIVASHSMYIKGPGKFSVQNILMGTSVHGSTWSATGDFLWVEIGVDACVDCEPEFRTHKGQWYLLGFISRNTVDKNMRWVATIRKDSTNEFFVMDHATCEPRLYHMSYLGPETPVIALYARNKPQSPAWLRQRPPSLPPGVSSPLLNREALDKDGLVTGSVNDLLTLCNCPSLQTDLREGIADLLAKVDQRRQATSRCDSAIKLSCVEGWPMPLPNTSCLVYRSNDLSGHAPGSVLFSKDFGNVPLKNSARSPMVPGINLMVCPISVVYV